MKSMKIKLMQAAVCLGMLSPMVSCTGNLELTPTSEITVAGFWTSEDNARGALNGMYVRFRDQSASNLFIWGEGRSGTLTYGLQASEGLERYFENTIDPNFAGPDWLRMYTVVHDANLLIAYVPEIGFTNEADKNRMLAEAYTMRAFVYYTMAKTWGGVPLVISPTEGYDAETTFRERSSVEAIFTQVKEDLNTALSLYPDNSLAAGKASWSKPAANALKGDVYLWTAKQLDGGNTDFQTALEALQEADVSALELLPNYDDIFRYDNKGNNEILMAVHFRDLESGTNYNSGMYIRDDQIPAGAAPEVIAQVGQGGGLNRWGPSPVVTSAFSNGDQRKNATFLSLTVPDEEGQMEPYANIVTKLKGYIDPSGRRFLDDVVLYRYADLLLMIAEAKNALGMDPSEEINRVRARAYGQDFEAHRFVDLGQVANDEAILQERLLELAYEGKRWWDLVRFDKEFELVPSLQGRENEQYLTLWPISLNTISLNSKIIQNPGYGN
ncbi:RagB/SusD family nutrient uptake outer membrane protein [Echinicola vietnamensis]|uniref:RagB/SusD family protein n=1 Tax=Echinicola vietnamensis (strain DSM 17526 / LMG 23754 / KMM 6221) TaxID=926556 RepID=L0G6S1_ECHVK|nr:RagB/SusD family nutrient uptake outer membrane protein [Echinicola vietnamensis]AGA80530.1 RagB/SusD family protein [Echinicola vietnamensis DSM 17526]